MTLLEKLAPYLPYDLGILDIYSGKEFCKLNIKNSTWILDVVTGKNHAFKPILRPLSDLLTYNESYFEILDEFSEYEFKRFQGVFIDEISMLNKFDYLSVGQYQLLLKHHFDVFGMIGSGEAIDINRH